LYAIVFVHSLALGAVCTLNFAALKAEYTVPTLLTTVKSTHSEPGDTPEPTCTPAPPPRDSALWQQSAGLTLRQVRPAIFVLLSVGALALYSSVRSRRG
jgi:hypothetical protein